MEGNESARKKNEDCFKKTAALLAFTGERIPFRILASRADSHTSWSSDDADEEGEGGEDVEEDDEDDGDEEERSPAAACC